MIGRLLKGEFEIVETLGAGGMGQVYIALQHSAGNRRVALKVLKSDLYGTAAWDNIVSRFGGEILSLSQLNHPNIVTLYTSGVDEATQTLFMAMELLAGESLEARLGRSRLGADEFFPFAGDILAGLAAAHERGIVHRDLKPANLMVVSHGREPSIKILDFGIAKILSSEATQLTLGPSPATLLYSSPEHFQDSSEIGPESDIFSLGIVAYRMASGLLPFRGRTQHELMRQILYEAPVPLGHESPRLEALISRMMSKEKGERPTLGAIQEELRDIAAGLTSEERWSAASPPPSMEAGALMRPDAVTVTARGGTAPAPERSPVETAPRPAAPATAIGRTAGERETARAETEPPVDASGSTSAETVRPAGDRADDRAGTGTATRGVPTAAVTAAPDSRTPVDRVPPRRRPPVIPVTAGALLVLVASGYLLTRGRDVADRGGGADRDTVSGPIIESASNDGPESADRSAAIPGSRSDSSDAETPPESNSGTRSGTGAGSPTGAKPPPEGDGGARDDAAAQARALETAKRAAETALDAANAERRDVEGLDKENLIPRLYFQELWSAASAAQARGLQERERKEYDRARRSFETATRDYRRVAAVSRRLFDEVLGKAGAKPEEKLAALESILRDYPGARENTNMKKLLADVGGSNDGG